MKLGSCLQWGMNISDAMRSIVVDNELWNYLIIELWNWQFGNVASSIGGHCLGQTFCVLQGGSSGHKARPANLSLTLSWLCRSEGSVTLSCISSSYFPIFASCQEKTLLERDFELHSAGARWCTVFWGVLSWCLSNMGCTEKCHRHRYRLI